MKRTKRKFLIVLFILIEIEYKWYAVGLSDNPTVPQAAPLAKGERPGGLFSFKIF